MKSHLINTLLCHILVISAMKHKCKSLTYNSLLQKLYQVNLFNGSIKLGLQNSHKLHEILGYPSSQYNIIHVAGTNGKGSVSWKIAKALETSGNKVGLFVSPHISCFRERIQVNGKYISEKSVEDILPTLFQQIAVNSISATFFEITTMLAFSYFASQGVNTAVIETGLGGRLDATNVALPCLTVITSIGLDHTSILGNTIEKIAMEKAGIMKQGVPVVVGPNVPHDILKEYAAIVNSPYIQVPSVTTNDYDIENSQVAIRAIKELQKMHQSDESKFSCRLDEQALEKIRVTRPPCRFEIIRLNNKDIVLDVAHNPPAINRLFQKLRSTFPNRKIRIICGFSADKDFRHCFQMFLENTSSSMIHLVRGQHSRCATLQDMLNSIPEIHHNSILRNNKNSQGVLDSSIDFAIQKIVQDHQPEENEITVICGSIFIMSEARRSLGLDQCTDPDSMVFGSPKTTKKEAVLH